MAQSPPTLLWWPWLKMAVPSQKHQSNCGGNSLLKCIVQMTSIFFFFLFSFYAYNFPESECWTNVTPLPQVRRDLKQLMGIFRNTSLENEGTYTRTQISSILLVPSSLYCCMMHIVLCSGIHYNHFVLVLSSLLDCKFLQALTSWAC